MCTFQISSFKVLLLESDGGVVQTPFCLKLPLSCVTENVPAIIVTDMKKIRTLFPVKNDPFVLRETASAVFTYGKNESTSSNYVKDPPPLHEEQLAARLQQNLNIVEDDATTRMDNSEQSLSVTKQRDINVLKSNKVKKKPLVREWKWSAPDKITQYSSLITSKAAFKMVFYCINLRDPNRVFSFGDYRKILRLLGYSCPLPENGLVNSARCHIRHTKNKEKCQRGSRSYLAMVRDDKQVQKYLDLADALLFNLDVLKSKE